MRQHGVFVNRKLWSVKPEFSGLDRVTRMACQMMQYNTHMHWTSTPPHTKLNVLFSGCSIFRWIFFRPLGNLSEVFLRKNRLNDWFGNYEKHRIVQDFLDDFLYDRFYWLLIKVSRLATYIYKCTICLLKSNAFVMTEKHILIGCVVSLSSSICFCQTQSDFVAECEVTAHFSLANVFD